MTWFSADATLTRPKGAINRFITLKELKKHNGSPQRGIVFNSELTNPQSELGAKAREVWNQVSSSEEVSLELGRVCIEGGAGFVRLNASLLDFDRNLCQEVEDILDSELEKIIAIPIISKRDSNFTSFGITPDCSGFGPWNKDINASLGFLRQFCLLPTFMTMGIEVQLSNGKVGQPLLNLQKDALFVEEFRDAVKESWKKWSRISALETPSFLEEIMTVCPLGDSLPDKITGDNQESFLSKFCRVSFDWQGASITVIQIYDLNIQLSDAIVRLRDLGVGEENVPLNREMAVMLNGNGKSLIVGYQNGKICPNLRALELITDEKARRIGTARFLTMVDFCQYLAY